MNEIVTERQEGILHLQPNRPQKRNAFTLDMYPAFADALRSASDDSAVQVVLVSAIGRRTRRETTPMTSCIIRRTPETGRQRR